MRVRAPLDRICTAERGLFRALQQLDRRLAVAVAVADTGNSQADADLRGLYLAGEDVARSLGRSPGESPWAAAQTAHDSIDEDGATWLRATLEAGGICAPADAFDAGLVLIALAPEVDLRYERVYAFLQDDVTRRRPTVELALGLLCPSFAARLAGRARLAADAPLISAGIIRLIADPVQVEPPLLAHYLKVDEQVVGFLLGQPGLDARLARYAALTPASDSAASNSVGLGLPPELIGHAARAAEAGRPLRLYFRERTGAGCSAAALALAAALDRDLLTVDLASPASDGEDVPELVRLALRDARFRRALPFLTGVDELSAEPGQPGTQRGPGGGRGRRRRAGADRVSTVAAPDGRAAGRRHRRLSRRLPRRSAPLLDRRHGRARPDRGRHGGRGPRGGRDPRRPLPPVAPPDRRCGRRGGGDGGGAGPASRP